MQSDANKLELYVCVRVLVFIFIKQNCTMRNWEMVSPKVDETQATQPQREHKFHTPT